MMISLPDPDRQVASGRSGAGGQVRPERDGHKRRGGAGLPGLGRLYVLAGVAGRPSVRSAAAALRASSSRSRASSSSGVASLTLQFLIRPSAPTLSRWSPVRGAAGSTQATPIGSDDPCLAVAAPPTTDPTKGSQ